MNDNKPIIKFNNGAIGVAIFESTRDTEYGPRTSYSCVLRKGVKDKTTGNWTEYKITLFEDQMLPAMELLRMAHATLIAHKSGADKTGMPHEPANQDVTEIGDDVPF